MLESLLMRKPGGKWLVGGPGPQDLIIGDAKSGFYGEFPGSEIYTGTGLASALGITEGAVSANTTTWFKFSHNNRIKYMPKQPIRRGCSWLHLFQKGVGFERTAPSDAVVSPGVAWVSQNTLLTHPDGYKFDVYLPSSIKDSYVNNPGNLMVEGAELYDLLFRCHRDWPGGTTGPNRRFATYVPADLLVAGADYTWSREAFDTLPDWRLCPQGASNGIGGYGYKDDLRDIISWRPVLELIL